MTPKLSPESRKPVAKFKPGQSGNPGGRPKGYAEIEALARSHAAEAIQALVKALDDDRLCVQAATALLDRGFGRPSQTINANLNFLDNLDDAELGSIERAIAALAGNAEGAAGGSSTAH